MSSTFAVTVQPAARMRGRVRPPGDKSISHRYAMLAAIADGPSDIHGYSTGATARRRSAACVGWACRSSRSAATARRASSSTILGLQVRAACSAVRNARRRQSGSTMRMLSGILAAHPFRATMTGDGSLRRRPMRRIIVPLERMGARIDSDEGRPP